MELQRKGTRHSHRGVIGVESAIVMIAFVIVAAALAYVVLNMGFTTSQKAKTTTLSSLEQSENVMKIAGTVTAVGCINTTDCNSIQRLNSTTIPLKISQPGNTVNFSPNMIAISYIGKNVQYNDIYAGPITSDTFRQPVLAFRQADLETGSDFDPFNGANPVNGTVPSQTSAFVYWAKSANNNQVLESGEHAILAVAFAENERPRSLDKISIEVIVSNGATLTVERHIPNITHEVMDLG